MLYSCTTIKINYNALALKGYNSGGGGARGQQEGFQYNGEVAQVENIKENCIKDCKAMW